MARLYNNSKNASRELDIVETEDYKRKFHAIRNKWRADFEAFCNERLKIVDKNSADGDPIKPFIFNQCQQSLHNLIEKIGDFNELRTTKLHERDPRVPIVRYPIEIIILKARKVGVSTLLEARAFWKAALHPAQKCLVMAHERPAAQNIADISQRFDTYWPVDEYPVTKVPITRMSDDLIEWEPIHGSSIVVETAGSKGGGSSRSFTYHLVHMSEVAFFPGESPQVAAALSARAPYHETYMESTANGVGNIFHTEWEHAMEIDDVVRLFEAGEPLPKWWNGKFKFFWPWFAQDENRIPLLEHESQHLGDTLDDDEIDLVENFNLDLEQIAWRRREIAGPCSKQTALLPKDFFRQEHPSTPEEAFVSRSNSLFDSRKLTAMMAEAKKLTPAFLGFLVHDEEDPTSVKMIPGGRYQTESLGDNFIEGAQFVQWELPVPFESYVIGVDAAEGKDDGDWSVISVFSRTDGTQIKEVARLRGKTPARELGEMAAYLGNIYNDAFIVCERNAPGNATVEKIVELGYTNLYHTRNLEAISNNQTHENFTPGFKTTASSKPMICERGVQGIRDGEIILRHPDAIREWKVFARDNRKYGAPSGFHDDTVIADLLAYFGMMEAPALSGEQLRAMKEAAISKLPAKTSEQIQNEYWQERIKLVRERCGKENQRRAEGLLRRAGLTSALKALS